MGFMFFIIGMAGIADAIVLDTDPTTSIVVAIIGSVLLLIEYKKFIDEQHRR